MKETGILLPVSALPSRSGVGELGKYAYEWLEMLCDAGITIWQILPLNPAGYGNSPYQPYSSFAGDEIYISLDGLLRGRTSEGTAPDYRKEESRINYEMVREFKEPYLRKAYEAFQTSKEYEAFKSQGGYGQLQRIPGVETGE